MRVLVLNVVLCLGLICSSAARELPGIDCRNGYCPGGRTCVRNSTCNTGFEDLTSEAISFLASNTRFPAHLAIVLTQPPNSQHLLTSNVSFALRTFESSALLLYAHDSRGNFLQLEVREGQIACKYNFLFHIFDFVLPRRVNDGRWHHFRIENRTFYVDNSSFINPGPRGDRALSSLTLPYLLRRNENIRPVTKNAASRGITETLITVFVGGIDRRMGSLPGFIGCLSSLEIGPIRVELQRSVGSTSPRVVLGCSAGCGPSICLNNGVCKEAWQGAFTCDCRRTKYSGRRCDVDVGRQFDGTGGFMLLLPSPTAMSAIGGKLVLNSIPRVGEVILHLQRAFLNVLLFVASEKDLSLVLQSQGLGNDSYGRLDLSFEGLEFPMVVRFSLWNSSTRRISLQIHDRTAELARFWRRRRVYIDRVIVGDAVAARRISIGGLNSSDLQHFSGCVNNLQVFFEGLHEPLELTLDDRARIGDETLNITRLTTGNISFCPIMVTTTPTTIASIDNSTNATVVYSVGSVKTAVQPSESMLTFWTIVVAVCGVMVLSFIVLGVVYAYYACEKRSLRQQHDKRTYRKVSSPSPDSLNSTGADTSHVVTLESNNNSSSIRHDFPEYKVPYKPAYTATSLILRDGKHIATPESDPDLGESAVRGQTASHPEEMDEGRISLIIRQRHEITMDSPTLKRLPSPFSKRRKQ